MASTDLPPLIIHAPDPYLARPQRQRVKAAVLGIMVNASYMTTATRNELGHLSLRLRGLTREIKVSRAFAHLFRPM